MFTETRASRLLSHASRLPEPLSRPLLSRHAVPLAVQDQDVAVPGQVACSNNDFDDSKPPKRTEKAGLMSIRWPSTAISRSAPRDKVSCRQSCTWFGQASSPSSYKHRKTCSGTISQPGKLVRRCSSLGQSTSIYISVVNQSYLHVPHVRCVAYIYISIHNAIPDIHTGARIYSMSLQIIYILQNVYASQDIPKCQCANPSAVGFQTTFAAAGVRRTKTQI